MITDAVIPVAGLGTRLLPATRSQPKEMLPLVDKPVVQYVVEELVAAGITGILLVTGRRKRAIEDHFDADPELERAIPHAVAPGSGVKILYTRQPRPRGLGDALRHAEGFAAGKPVVVALGDAIIEPARTPSASIVTRLISAYEQHGASAALAVGEVPGASVPRYGIVIPGCRASGAGAFEVADVIEKPMPQDVASRTAVMAALALAVETEDLGIAAGLQDRVAQAYGGLSFMEFAEHRYEQLDPGLLPPLVIAWRAHTAEHSGRFCSDL